jgi:hypothetical protein
MDFWVLRGHLCQDGSEFDFDPGDTTAVDEAPRCETCGSFYGMLPFVPPITGTLIADRTLFDLSADAGSVLISERCLRAFDGHEIRGLIDPQPIELLAVEGPFDLAILGQFFWAQAQCGAEIDRARSNLRTTAKPCRNCGAAGLMEGYDRVAIAESSWDGRDLLLVKGLPGAILVTERVKQLCEQLKLQVCGLMGVRSGLLQAAEALKRKIEQNEFVLAER